MPKVFEKSGTVNVIQYGEDQPSLDILSDIQSAFGNIFSKVYAK